MDGPAKHPTNRTKTAAIIFKTDASAGSIETIK
jgi:hypothetical protein